MQWVTKEVHIRSHNEVSQLRNSVQYDTDMTFFFQEPAGDSSPPRGDRGGGGANMQNESKCLCHRAGHPMASHQRAKQNEMKRNAFVMGVGTLGYAFSCFRCPCNTTTKCWKTHPYTLTHLSTAQGSCTVTHVT